MNLQEFKRRVATTVVSAANSDTVKMDRRSVLTLFGSTSASVRSEAETQASATKPGLLDGLQELWSETQYAEELDSDLFVRQLYDKVQN